MTEKPRATMIINGRKVEVLNIQMTLQGEPLPFEQLDLSEMPELNFDIPIKITEFNGYPVADEQEAALVLEEFCSVITKQNREG